MKIQNIINVLSGVLENRGVTHSPIISELLRTIQESPKPLLLAVQPGAGAPVKSFLSDWMEAGLGGCTAEVCRLSTIGKHVLVINTMSLEEQAAITNEDLKAALNPAGKVRVFNDPDRVLEILLGLQTIGVHDRIAYLPVFGLVGEDGQILKTHQPKLISGVPRDEMFLPWISTDMVVPPAKETPAPIGAGRGGIFGGSTVSHERSALGDPTASLKL